MKQLELLLLFFFTAILSSAQSIPAIKAKALVNSEITLPSPGSQQFLILIVGFSQKSGKLCEVWGKQVSADYHTDARIAYFIFARPPERPLPGSPLDRSRHAQRSPRSGAPPLRPALFQR